MTDPVSNAEVEDVLSSIRRLVSEEKRSPEKAETPFASDRLVLTPALRVEERAVVVPTPIAQDTPPEPELDQIVPQPDAADETEMQTSQRPQVSIPKDWIEKAQAELDAEARSAAQLDHGEDMIEDMVETDVSSVSPFSGDEHRLTENAAEISETPELASPEPAPEVDSVEPFQDVAEAEITPADTNHEARNEMMEELSSSASLGAKIAALETVIGRTDDQWEPDDTGDSDYSGTDAPSLSWEDAEAVVEETVAEAPQEIPEAIIEQEPVQAEDIFGAPEDILDEDALRDLVSDIVREELQGALGERITRNVRKLVRREIHRALAAQELE